ncbi:transposase [Streptomyces microflavus]|uniref:transposase n=1 Tax=Streptomyces microflavus TaxID=1919 RepID=UPI0035DAFB95
MGMKNYPLEFKAEAVALHASRPEATIRSVAADPGINPETLRPNTKYIGDITHLPILGRTSLKPSVQQERAGT